MVVVCGPSDILYYWPHRYANSSLDKPTHGCFLCHYGMDFAVTLWHNQTRRHRSPSRRYIEDIPTHVDDCFFASVIDIVAIFYHTSWKKAETLSRISAFFCCFTLVPSKDEAPAILFVDNFPILCICFPIPMNHTFSDNTSKYIKDCSLSVNTTEGRRYTQNNYCYLVVNYEVAIIWLRNLLNRFRKDYSSSGFMLV